MIACQKMYMLLDHEAPALASEKPSTGRSQAELVLPFQSIDGHSSMNIHMR
jgi:hypothetical protein